MKAYKKMVPLLLSNVFIFYIVPSFLGHDKVSGTTILILFSGFVFISSVYYGTNNQVRLSYALIIGIISLPAVFYYYPEFALTFSIICCLVAYIGSVLGRVFTFVGI